MSGVKSGMKSIGPNAAAQRALLDQAAAKGANTPAAKTSEGAKKLEPAGGDPVGYDWFDKPWDVPGENPHLVSAQTAEGQTVYRAPDPAREDFDKNALQLGLTAGAGTAVSAASLAMLAEGSLAVAIAGAALLPFAAIGGAGAAVTLAVLGVRKLMAPPPKNAETAAQSAG